MPLKIIHEDITKIPCDVIVNPTDSSYSGDGGADMAIHQAAGPKLAEACQRLKPLSFGAVNHTPGFNLPCKYVIHTMGPIWFNGQMCESVLLRSCYLNALLLADELKAESIAFPLISSGAFGFPKDKVLKIAIDAITDFLFASEREMNVTISVIDKDSYELGYEVALNQFLSSKGSFMKNDNSVEFVPAPVNTETGTLEDWIAWQDKSFSELLFELIEKKNYDHVRMCKKANVSKNTFYKIKNDPNYRPSKETAICLAVALKLSLEETNAFLKTAGYTLSDSNKSDRIVAYHIINGKYSVGEINAALYGYDQKLLCNY